MQPKLPVTGLWSMMKFEFMDCDFRFCICFTLVILLFNIPLGFSSELDSKAFQTATELINNGKYLEAVGLYREIAEGSSFANNRARALLFSGTIYDLYLDQPETALKLFKRLCKIYPESPAAPDALFNSGLILYKTDRYQEAFEIYRSYLEKYPENMRRDSAIVWEEKAKEKISALPEKQRQIRHLTLGPEIRVLLKKKAGQLIFTSPSKMTLSNPATGKIIFSGTGPVAVSTKAARMTINTEKISAGKCKVETENDCLGIDGQPYRGSIFVYMDALGLTAVNHLDIEKYLYGVVPKEMSWLWSEQALMAQAIASRTFALYLRKKQPANQLYDLTATTASQVYGGYGAEHDKARGAVDQTRGKVMLFNGKLIIAYFHADSGGYTESSENVWGVDIPYLKSISDKFSLIASEPEWMLFLSYKELGKLLKTPGLNPGKIKKIRLEDRSESGRVNSFYIVGDKAKIRLKGNTFRMKLGATRLKSTCLETSLSKSGILFKGKGYGHGVGMSQWGAHQMALADCSFFDILRHYYKGIDIADVVYK